MQPLLLAGGAGISLPVSVPLGISRHVYDLQMVAVGPIATEAGAYAENRSRRDDRCPPDEAELQLDASAGVRPVNQLISATAGDQGAGKLGFIGTADRQIPVPPPGLSTLAGSALGGGPRLPLVPASWASN